MKTVYTTRRGRRSSAASADMEVTSTSSPPTPEVLLPPAPPPSPKPVAVPAPKVAVPVKVAVAGPSSAKMEESISENPQDHRMECEYYLVATNGEINLMCNDEAEIMLEEHYGRGLGPIQLYERSMEIQDNVDKAMDPWSPVQYYLREQQKTFKEMKLECLKGCRCPGARRGPVKLPGKDKEKELQLSEGSSGED